MVCQIIPFCWLQLLISSSCSCLLASRRTKSSASSCCSFNNFGLAASRILGIAIAAASPDIASKVFSSVTEAKQLQLASFGKLFKLSLQVGFLTPNKIVAFRVPALYFLHRLPLYLFRVIKTIAWIDRENIIRSREGREYSICSKYLLVISIMYFYSLDTPSGFKIYKC